MEQTFRFPDGAPLFTGADTILAGGMARYPAWRWSNLECRIFVTMTNGRIQCRESTSIMPGVKRRITVTGLTDARIVFRPEADHVKSVRFYRGDPKGTLAQESEFASRLEPDATGARYVLEHVTGDLQIAWAEEE